MSRPPRPAARILRSNADSLRRFLLLSVLTLLVCLLSAHAFAQATPTATTITADDTVTRIGHSAVSIPRLAAVFSYALGVLIVLVGLLKFRAWIDDSNRNTLNAALYRMIVGAFLIALPHIFILINNTFFGSQAAMSATDNHIKPPRFFAFDK